MEETSEVHFDRRDYKNENIIIVIFQFFQFFAFYVFGKENPIKS